jgi:DNA-binding NarL/FixJ family response regulator
LRCPGEPMGETMQVRILLVDDHKLFRDGLRSLLSARRGMQIVGEAVDGSTALKEVRRLSPDVVFMDV